MGDYRSLRVWDQAHALVLDIYHLTRSFPDYELYGLAGQMRRSAASVPSNLAEGTGRNSTGEISRFCRISLGSANELEYQLLLAHDLGYLTDQQYAAVGNRVDRVKRMLSNLLHSFPTS